MTTRNPRTPRLAPEIRRRQLLDAALEVLAEDGFDALTVEAVAQRAGVTRPVVYDMFGDFEGLMLALIEREERSALAPLLELLGGKPGDEVDPDSFFVDAVSAFLLAVRANPRTWRLVLMPPRGSWAELRTRIDRSRRLLARRVAALLEWGVAKRGGPGWLDHELAARLIVAAGEDAARLMLAHPRRFAPERLVAATRGCLALFPPGLHPRGDPPPRLARSGPPEALSQAPAQPLGMPLAEPNRRSSRRLPQGLRREQLLDVALALLAEQGFERVSVEAIARRAGVNRAVVYRSFPNLQLLLLALLRREDRRTRVALASLLPRTTGDCPPGQLLGEVLARFLDAVVQQPQTWRLALLRPESAPLALQKVVTRRRAQLARRLEPLVQSAFAGTLTPQPSPDVEVLARMLLSIGEEQGRLALDDSDFPSQRLLESSWKVLDAMPSSEPGYV